MRAIPDFTEGELDTIRALTEQRFREAVELHLADAEVRLDKHTDALTDCPTVYWQSRGCNFVVFKTGEHEYRCQFFYNPMEQYGTGHERYEDLAQCVSALLQVQSDHEREQHGVSSGATGQDIS